MKPTTTLPEVVYRKQVGKQGFREGERRKKRMRKKMGIMEQ